MICMVPGPSNEVRCARRFLLLTNQAANDQKKYDVFTPLLGIVGKNRQQRTLTIYLIDY
jgi:hypothetical protein